MHWVYTSSHWSVLAFFLDAVQLAEPPIHRIAWTAGIDHRQSVPENILLIISIRKSLAAESDKLLYCTKYWGSLPYLSVQMAHSRDVYIVSRPLCPLDSHSRANVHVKQN